MFPKLSKAITGITSKEMRQNPLDTWEIFKPMEQMKALTYTTWKFDTSDISHTDEKRFLEMLYCATALGGETGELLNVMKKYFRKRAKTLGHSKDDSILLDEIKDECADVLYYLLRICDMFDIDLDKAFSTKMAINEKRYNDKSGGEIK